MPDPLYGAVATVVVGLLGLAGTLLLRNVQQRAAANEERLSRYENWDHLIDNYRQDSDRFRQQRDEAWVENDRLRAENRTLRSQVERWLEGREPNA